MARSARLLVALVALVVAAPAHADAPTAAAIVARARQLHVGDEAQRLRGHFLPGLRMLPGGTAAVGATRIGGEPDLAAKATWPACHGHKLSFLAQIDVSDLGRGAGTLSVFADLEEDEDGVTPIELFSGKVACPVAVRFARGRLARRGTPHGVHTLRSTPIRLRPTLTIPSWEPAEELLGGGNRPDPFFDRWESLFDETAWGVLGHKPPYRPVHQLLGWASAVQADLTTEACKGDRLLLQLDDDPTVRFDYGDAGVLYIAIRPADLRAGRYDRLCGEFQEG